MPLPSAVLEILARPRAEVRVALVGASNAGHKYGSIIFRDLSEKGFDVIPVNPRHKKIHGKQAYARVADVPDPIDIVNFVVPPEAALDVLRNMSAERCAVVWFQPGAFHRAVIEEARARFTHVVAGPCIMVET